MKLIPLLVLTASLAVSTVSAAVLTNADIVKMSDAKLGDGIIVTTIENSEAKFDTSTDGLIELSKAKVSQPVIAAMLKRGTGPVKAEAPATAPAPAAAPASDIISPSELRIMEGTEAKPMRYLNPQMRTAARGFGYGGMATYAVLRGPAANYRTKNGQPTFLVSVPDQAQPESYVTLASFAVRQNNSREVMIGGGYMSYSSGIHPDRVIAVGTEKSPDQSKAQKGFTIYTVVPRTSLAPGEYAVILYTGEMHGLVGSWFSGTGNAYFDFGVTR